MESRLGRRAPAGPNSHLPALVLCAPPLPQRTHEVLPLWGLETQHVTCMVFEPGQLAECPELSLLRNLNRTQQVEKQPVDSCFIVSAASTILEGQ